MALSQADLAAAYAKGLRWGVYNDSLETTVGELHASQSSAMKARPLKATRIAMVLSDGSVVGLTIGPSLFDYGKWTTTLGGG
jgi:hypothetical protein